MPARLSQRAASIRLGSVTSSLVQQHEELVLDREEAPAQAQGDAGGSPAAGRRRGPSGQLGAPQPETATVDARLPSRSLQGVLCCA